MAEYMTDDDRVAAIRKWWEENGTGLVVGLVIVVAGVIGWRWWVDYDRSHREAAAEAYQRYLDLREAGGTDTEGMARALDTLDRDHEGSGYHTFTLFYRAADAVAREDFADAESLLSKAMATAKDDHLAGLARLRLARIQHQLGKDDDALGVLQGAKGAGFASAAAELKGDILLAQGRRAEALEAYRAAAEAAGEENERLLLRMKIADLTTAGESDTTAGESDAPAS